VRIEVTFYLYIRDYIGKIMVLTGVVLLITGVLAINSFGSVFSAGSLFLGILFAVFGFFVQVGFFSGNLRSLNGAATILICISIVFLAFSLVIIEFLEARLVGYVQMIFHGAPLPFSKAVISTNRPFLWLSSLSLQVGFVFFIAGIALKAFHVLKS